ncbi:SEN34 subunit of tRNA-splicing endonuclease [Hypoxylon trugodes]|uniref:SEN34 subunit of tRNA-splicing endonuclease n=1 Tax=Hypoxylon trugodes TaxID=326681 RepID=UPI002199D5F5|nr:SEN34 subunit of tRNA-splicing endonuclease [Hypoxylon trugodes]KAI1383372.1 SEN34 subunit of tRNA-splicing endonuclease [Hypoxylon trugodes]
MASTTISRPPVRISKVAGRYLLFDIDDIMYIRRNHNICSVFVGTIPQNPQQNIFMGLPVELMPEEAQILIDKKVGYIVNDAAFHPAQLGALDEDARRRYLQAIKGEGRKAQLAAAEGKQNMRPKVSTKSKKKPKATDSEVSNEANAPEKGPEVDDETSLFGPPSPPRATPSPAPHNLSKTAEEPQAEFAITPTTSSLLPPSPPVSADEDGQTTPINVPPSYPLYAHLQDRGYYMMPGLRFGCDYNVYPGDPLRFHSHFQATSYGWDEEITMLDLVAGGRLGTNVKKGYLVGGAVVDGGDGDGLKEEEAVANKNPNAPGARAFCIEWAAM